MFVPTTGAGVVGKVSFALRSATSVAGTAGLTTTLYARALLPLIGSIVGLVTLAGML